MQGFFWVLVGVGFSWLHLFLLRRSLVHVADADQSPDDAGKQIARSLPLRLVLLSPFLLIVARAGVVASGGLILGSLLGRWFLILRAHKVL
jgi:hypothetical protein